MAGWASREQVSAALFALPDSILINGISPWKNGGGSRRVQLIPDTPPELQPAFYQLENQETDDQSSPGMPPKRTWRYLWIIYAQNKGKPDTTWSTTINPLLDAIDQCLAPDDGSGRLTLGGLVYWVRKSGQTAKETGDIERLKRQGAILIPVHILVP